MNILPLAVGGIENSRLVLVEVRLIEGWVSFYLYDVGRALEDHESITYNRCDFYTKGG